MVSRLRRALFSRTTVAAAVVAIPLLASGSAQAAIAGGNPITTVNRPDLVSAQELSSTRDVQVCFDKQIATTSSVLTSAQNNLGGFVFLAGYRSHNTLFPSAVNIDQNNNKCIVVSFPSTVSVTPSPSPAPTSNSVDLHHYTVLTMVQGAVTATGTNGENLDDSTTLVPFTPPGSARVGTHNGTRGLTTAPDLVGTSPVPSSIPDAQALVFTFDQNVSRAVASDFYIVDAQGERCNGTAIDATLNNAVVVHFPINSDPGVGPGCSGASSTVGAGVTNYVRDGVFDGGVNSAADTGSYNGTEGAPSATAVNNGATALPGLVSAVLEPNGNTIDYTFDKPVNLNIASDFEVILSPADNSSRTGAVLHATSATGAGANTIAATFTCNSGGSSGCQFGAPADATNGTSLQNESEYAVIASVETRAVTDIGSGSSNNPDRNTSGDTNVPGSAPIGGNSGAFGNGFTTGADAYAVTINKANGVVTVFLDQRVQDCNPTSINLIRNDGTDLGSPTGSGPNECDSSGGVFIPGYNGGSADTTYPPPGPEAITMQFANAQTGSAVGLQLLDRAFQTPLFDGNSSSDKSSVAQIIAQVGSGAHIKAAVKSHKSHKAVKHHKHHSKKHASKKK